MAGPVSSKTPKENSAKQAESLHQELAHSPSLPSHHASVLNLQRSAGNQAVSQLLQSDGVTPESEPDDVPPIVRSVLNSNGQPLDPATRAFMESRFGQDFSQVRIYTDTQAAKSAAAVNARAYTVGSKVVFGAGQYPSESVVGRRLLAHELAHVVQQQGTNAAPQKNTHVPILNNPALDREADAVETHVALGQSVTGMVSGRVTGGAKAQMKKAEDSPGSENEPLPKIADFPKGRLRDIDELLDLLPFDQQAVVLGKIPRDGPFVVGPIHAPSTVLGIKLDRAYGPFFTWVENGIARWMPAAEVPPGPTRLGDWWIWSDGTQIQIGRRYSEDPAFVTARLQRPIGSVFQREPTARQIGQRLEAWRDLNREIEIRLGKGRSLETALAETRRNRQTILETMVLGSAVIFSSFPTGPVPTERPVAGPISKWAGKIIPKRRFRLPPGLEPSPAGTRVTPSRQLPPRSTEPIPPAATHIPPSRQLPPQAVPPTSPPPEPAPQAPPGSVPSIPARQPPPAATRIPPTRVGSTAKPGGAAPSKPLRGGLESKLPGEVGRVAEKVQSNIIGTPQNPGPAQGGGFATPYANVEPDFIPAVDTTGQVVFAREPTFARVNGLPGINDALLVADSKYLGVLGDEVPIITFRELGSRAANQVKGMIYLSQFTKSRTFVFLGRLGQTIGPDIQQFAKALGVDVTIRTSPLVRGSSTPNRGAVKL